MSYSIKDRLDFQLQIGGKPVELEHNMLDFFHVVESVRLYVPMMTLRIKDISKFFTRNEVLVDGTPVVVSVAVEKQKTIYPFRLFSHKAIAANGITSYQLHAYLDIPRYWTESIVTPMNDTASSVLSTLCKQSGLTYDGVTTNDQQIWIPENKRRAEFAKYVMRHAYLDDTSCCQMGISVDKKMRMRNVSEFDKLSTVQTFSNVESQTASVITDYNMLNKSGFFNAVTGYKDKQVRQSFLKDDEYTSDLQVKKNSRKLSVSQSIQKGVDQNRVTYSPIDCGNVNENYERAYYQNERFANLFTFGIEFVTPRLVNANLLDVISCELSNPGAPSVTALSGRYMVTSRVAYIENMNFYQKVEAFRQGTNSPRENTQV